MNKVLFCSPHMIAGGVEKALLGMFIEMDDSEWDVTALFVRARGGFIEQVPKSVKVEEISVTNEQADRLLGGGAKSCVKYYLKKKKIFTASKIAIKKTLGYFCPEFLGNFNKILKRKEKYDIAVCYHIHMPFIVRYVAQKIDASKKIAWVHNDFINSGYKVKKIKKYLDCYDKFFAVSKKLLDEFVSIFPEYKDKTEVFYNIINKTDILNKAKEICDWGNAYDGIKILSVGRLDMQKGFDLSIEAAAILKSKNYDFRWYIIGEGSERENLEKIIEKNNLQNNFVLLGEKSNPYPYYKNCDIYCQPSRHEGYCLTLAEARCLNKPIVATDFTGAREQIKNGEDGFIVDINSNDIAHHLEKLIYDKEICKRFIKNLQIEKNESFDSFYKFEKLVNL